MSLVLLKRSLILLNFIHIKRRRVSFTSRLMTLVQKLKNFHKQNSLVSLMQTRAQSRKEPVRASFGLQ